MSVLRKRKVAANIFPLVQSCTKALDFVLPPSCLVSGEIVERQGMLAPGIWSSLDFITEPLCGCCGRPFDFEQESGALCGECLAKRPVFGRARAALHYDDNSRNLILRFKHADQTHAVIAFIPWMKRAGRELLRDADFLVPVPLHRLRLLKRRYNQAALIARALSRETGVPWLPDTLVRRRRTASQGYMSSRDRTGNVRNAFAVPENRASGLQGKHAVLIDDVYTTGATVKECTKILLKTGCRQVDVLTVARVVRPGIVY